VRRGALLVALALVGADTPAPTGAPNRAQRLEQMRAEIEAREASARELAERAEGVLGELEGIDRELAEVRASARRLRVELPESERAWRDAEQGIQDAEAAVLRAQRDLESRLVALYKVGATAGLSTLYAAADVGSFLRRRDALARILAEDERLFESHREARRELVASRERSRAALTELRGARRELAVREARIREQAIRRRNLIDLLRTRSDRERRAAQELRDAAARLEEAIAKLPAEVAPSPSEAVRVTRHGLLPPVEGPVRAGFGRVVDPEFGTRTIRNGIEFEAPSGAPVWAPADGRVLFAGWFRGYGQIVILDHGSGSVTVSGYLDEVAVQAGASVRAGARIGSVGETGSLSGPGLYFEVRREGKPVDPLQWLGPVARQGEEGTE
jgi:septal ring factor EnvC (AmiA/AmiB activator)